MNTNKRFHKIFGHGRRQAESFWVGETCESRMWRARARYLAVGVRRPIARRRRALPSSTAQVARAPLPTGAPSLHQ
ncbi:hypothetical protein, partial [Burkholderia sp. Se-20378]|uniref:hypothetical protein n=1 Tax=Burkholderia sp. Se-20378 TaxID=2703899 RepID=UPI001980D260